MRIALLVVLAACGSKPEEVPAGDPTAPPSKKKVAVDAGVAKQPTPKAPITSPLPEKGPHPDYPTPVAAGTDKIFLIEEPDRGPLPPLDFPYPASTDGTSHAYCDLGATAVVCTDAKPTAKTGIWFTSSKSRSAMVVLRHRGSMIEAAHVYASENGALKQRVVFDAYRRLESAQLFSSPTRYTKRMRNGRNGLPGCGSMDVEVDKLGRTMVRRCLQWNGEPMRDTSGVASTKYTRDPRGLITDERRFGLDGKPIAANDNVHHARYQPDAVGRDAVETYFGLDGKPISNTKGCHGYRYERDNGLVVRTTCIGADDKPSNDSRTIASQEFGYDTRGCQTKLRNVALAGKPPRDPGVDYVVDERCGVLSHTCVEPKGDRVACATGDPARYDYKRDDFGQPISISHYEPDGTAGKNPAWNTFELRHEYDDRGNPVISSCYDAFGKAAECTRLGFARQKAEYDDVGREVSRVFFDVAGNPAMNTGASTRKFIYDNYDHVFEGRGYDKDGRVLESFGMAVRRDLYDIAHRKFAVVLLDKNGKPARYTGCYGGATCPKQWHAVRIVRKPDGTVDKNEFFDDKGQLIDTKDCAKVRCFR